MYEVEQSALEIISSGDETTREAGKRVSQSEAEFRGDKGKKSESHGFRMRTLMLKL